MKRDAFSVFHPAVNLAFFLAVLGMTMLLQHPVYLLISLASGCAYLGYLRGAKALLRQAGYLLPLLVLMAVMNPLFNHQGNTVLLYLPNDSPVTLEALCFGLASAAMMGASIVWFGCLSVILTSDKIIYLFGRGIPSLSLLLSMTMRFVPRFQNFLKSVLQTQRAMHQPQNRRQQLQQALSAFSATVSWAMEQSLVTADSMKSRGYGIPGRTSFSIYGFEKRDGGMLALLVLLGSGTAAAFLSGAMEWVYYPGLSGALFGPVQAAAYCCYGGMCNLPLIVDWMEDRKWKALKSGI